ncbi:MAG TPA: hypothetical protein VGO43_09955 [Pyrinomonadaceae bacterium]|jgi:hypothetical protein|nr:hypothetical protein [Pyrinomonadaceae bacterium]
MKRFLRIIGILAVAVLLLQIPFAYRACQVSTTANRIREANVQSSPISGRFREYRGVMHVHSVHSGEISDSFDELLNAGCDNQLDFVMLTEHYSTAFDTSALTLNGWYGSTLYVAGNELNSRPGDRVLMVPGGPEAAGMRLKQTNEAIDEIHAKTSLAFVAYPEKFAAWDTAFDGVEVFNLNTELRAANPVVAALDYPWSGQVDRPLAISRYLTRPDANLRSFDEIAAKRKIVLTAGLDAHSAIGFHIFGDDLGQHLFGIKVDPYSDIFRIARLHMLADPKSQLTRDSLIAALKNGSFFVGFDVLGDTTGFRFSAEGSGQSQGMGAELNWVPGTKLRASSLIPARIVILKNGEKLAESSGATELTADVTGPAAYRVEVYREGLGLGFENVPWILSNPIYIR